MGFKEILSNIRNRIQENQEEPREYDDDETRDRYLRSLRRERRVQKEEVEKIRLKKQIAEYKKKRVRKHLYGFKEGIARKKPQTSSYYGSKPGLLQSNMLKKKNKIL